MNKTADRDEPVRYGVIAVAIGLSALFGLAVLPHLAPSTHGMVGKPAPEVVLPVAAGGEPGARMALSDLRGSAVILDFWASWCGPCAVQAPILERISRRYEDRGLVVLGINVDDPPAMARAYALDKELTYPIVTDPTGEAQRLYGVSKLPSLVVVDRDGRVAGYVTGLVDEGALDELVASAM